MRTIVHLSDLHFNAVNDDLIEPLVASVQSVAPDVLAVSGDLTQHAWPAEFRRAAELMKRLPGVLIVVPGNHDMSFYNPVRRATQRLRLFRDLITADPEPFYADDEIAVLGLNTARVRHLRDGRIREWQVRRLEEKLGKHPMRVLVTHHPFDLPAVYPGSEILSGGQAYIRRVVRSVDVLLAGHMHISHAGPTALRYEFEAESAVFVQAGTALSTRGRGELNAFQVIRTTVTQIEVTQHSFTGAAFTADAVRRFERQGGGWQLAAGNGPHSVSA
jgi:3',5'-cyclic AMP phosphodiesterase CpdA